LIHEVDGRLKDWVGSVLQGATVSLAAPNGQLKGSGVSLYLLQLTHRPPARGGKKRPPLQLLLRYLVTAWSEDPEDAHRMLGELVFAAMEHDEFEVEFDAAPAAIWTAFGAVPRPSFILGVPVRRERPQPEAPLVRSGVSLDSTAAVSLHGVVTGPGDLPLMGARVECPSLGLSAQTDSRGRFRFSTVPATPPPEFRVTAKGKALTIRADSRSLSGEAFVIHFDDLE